MTHAGTEAAELNPAAGTDPPAAADPAAADPASADPAGAATGDPGLATERDRLARSLRETRLQLAMTQARLTALEGSATMELGRTLVRAARRPWSRGVQLPADLVRLWRERGGLTGPGAATLALASAQLSDLSGVGERFLSALTAPALGERGLVVTGVLTANTCAALEPDAAALPLLPHDADVMLESAGADLVLIEAAAMLAGSAWAYAGDPAATDRGRRLGRMIAAARALGKPVIFVRNVPAHLAPGLDWVAASCDVVSDDGFGVQLSRFNPIGLAADRPAEPVYAGGRDSREAPVVRRLLDALTEAGDVRLAGDIGWAGRPAFYREHAVFVTASPDQARDQLASGARVVLIGAGQVAGADVPGTELAAVRAALAAPRRDWPEIVAGLREICAEHATPARLGALAALTGLGDHMISGRQVAVLAQADDVAAASALSATLTRQRLAPAEVVVVVGGGPATGDGHPAGAGPAGAGLTGAGLPGAAEVVCRGVRAALGDLADRGVTVRAIPAGPDGAGEPGWIRQAAAAARSPWVAPWPAAGTAGQPAPETPGSYLLDLVCARECSQADAVGWAGAAYEYAASLAPALARRDYFGRPGQGPRLFSVS